MKLVEKLLPPGYRFRELWLPELIKGNASMPSLISNGHALALTGAKQGTTVDGVHFTGAADSNINCGALHNGVPKLWVSFRFKLDAEFNNTLGNPQFLWGIYDDGNNSIMIYLDNADGRLVFYSNLAATVCANLRSDEDTWNAGQWYHVFASISDVGPVQRLIIDNGTPVTGTEVTQNTAVADFVIGDRDDPGPGTGLEGVIADFFCEEGNDLTTTEEEDLYRGIPPNTADNAYPLDEGYGVTAYDRGADADNGTLDTTASWAWGHCKQPVISMDGINDHAESAAGVDVSGDITMVWAGKLKVLYNGVSADHFLVEYFIDGNNNYQIYLHNITGDIRFLCVVGGTTAWADLHGFAIEIDDYAIFIGTVTAGGAIALYANGILHSTDTGLDPIAVGGITTFIGADDSPGYYDTSKPLLVALIDGALSSPEIKALSRNINNHFGLGLSII